MKSNNQNKNRLDELFAKVKQQKSLLSNEDVNNLISNAPTGAYPWKQPVKFFINNLNLIIMSTIVSSILITSIIFLAPSENGNTQTESDSSIVVKSELLVATESRPTEPKYNDENERNTEFKVPVTPTKTKKPIALVHKEVPCKEKLYKRYGDEFIISLSFNEFCKLGLMNDDKMWYFYNHSPDSVISGLSISKRGSWSLEDNSAVSLARKNLTFTTHDFYPACITDRYSTTTIMVLSQQWLEFQRCLNCKPTYKKLESPPILVVEFKEKEKFTDFSNFEIANDTLIPVTIKVNYADTSSESYKMAKKARHYTEKIFWFKPSETFYNSLPERYSEKVNQFYNDVKQLKESPCYKEKDMITYFSINRMENTLSEIPKLSLSPTELHRIGFRLFNDSIIYSYTDGASLMKIKLANKTIGGKVDPIPEEDDTTYKFNVPLKFVSKLNGERPVSWDFGENRQSPANYSDLFFLDRINRLLAVQIEKNLCNGCIEEELIFWISPEQTFLDSLPERYRGAINAEYNSLLIHSNPNISKEVKDVTPKYCTYFEECRPTYPELEELKVYPNPSKYFVHIEFKLKVENKVRVALFDINGRPVRILKDMETMQAGSNIIEINMSSLSSGIYILTLLNSTGSYKTQRIIKQ